MAGIMESLFGKKPEMPVTNPNAPTPGNIPVGAASGQQGVTEGNVAANGVVPSGVQKEATAESPFKAFESLWETKNADGTPIKKPDDPLYKVDPKQLMDIAHATDFKSAVSKETIAAIVAGGQGGVEAMMEAMQKMSATVYANAAVAATKIAESGITRAMAAYEAKLPGQIRNQQLSESLSVKNPALRDPAVAPIVALIRNQMADKYPNASAAELQQQAEQYFLAAGNAFAPKPAAPEVTGSQAEDWSKFFNLDPQ